MVSYISHSANMSYISTNVIWIFAKQIDLILIIEVIRAKKSDLGQLLQKVRQEIEYLVLIKNDID